MFGKLPEHRHSIQFSSKSISVVNKEVDRYNNLVHHIFQNHQNKKILLARLHPKGKSYIVLFFPITIETAKCRGQVDPSFHAIHYQILIQYLMVLEFFILFLSFFRK